MLDNMSIKRYNVIRKKERKTFKEILKIGTGREPAKKGRSK